MHVSVRVVFRDRGLAIEINGSLFNVLTNIVKQTCVCMYVCERDCYGNI